jgi:uncharacterized YigZ family protein
MKESYFTIDAQSQGLYKDRGSKFFAFAIPVSSEEEIKTHLDKLRKEYHDARHHCYGWMLKSDYSMSRANDDGEPSSSAGKPILNQIESRELTNVLVVVIRYFGGTLLGVGGLINAYRTAAAEALENSNIIKKYIYKTFEIHFNYSLMNAVMKIIKEHDLNNYDHQFELSCSLKLDIRIDQVQKVLDQYKLIKGCKIDPVIPGGA